MAHKDVLDFLITLAAVVGLFGGALIYWRNGTLKAAVETISILQSQLDIVQRDRADLSERVKALEAETRVLRELVTHAAKVEEFADRVESMHSTRRDQYEAIDRKLNAVLERLDNV